MNVTICYTKITFSMCHNYKCHTPIVALTTATLVYNPFTLHLKSITKFITVVFHHHGERHLIMFPRVFYKKDISPKVRKTNSYFYGKPSYPSLSPPFLVEGGIILILSPSMWL